MEAPASTIEVRVKFMGDLPAVIGQRNTVVTLPQGDVRKYVDETMIGGAN